MVAADFLQDPRVQGLARRGRAGLDGKSILSDAKRGSLLAVLFHLAFWRMDLSYFGRGLLGSWPQADAGVVLWTSVRSTGRTVASGADLPEPERRL
jgi:hypothetical protein